MRRFLILLLLASMLLEASSLSLERKEIFLKELKKSPSLHTTKTYNLTKGWNTLTTPKDGVVVPQTFDSSKIQLVVAYDKESKLWATFSSYENFIAPSMKSEKILFLKYLEPNTTFFVLANRDISVKINSIVINQSCKDIISNDSYADIINSVLDDDVTWSKDKTISIKTGYLTHHERGIYNETRVVLIYPKLETKTIHKPKETSYLYGPAFPKVRLKYTKEYEEKKFYIFDYKVQKCYMGIFPSKRIPPFPILREI